MSAPELTLSKRRLRELQRDLLSWYRMVRRDLPWRRTTDPYAIWVSEVMLQQTRVETARGYYEPFLERFPAVEALAAASLDDVLASWSGLGYYTRARSLHRAARMVVEEHGGSLPRDPKALAKLPGFGPYTVAAVGSIALGLDLAAVDGNIARVFTRWSCFEGDPREAKALASFRRLGQGLLPRGEAGDWNQAVMELGATLCGPTSPACMGCPAAAICKAHQAGRQSELPPRRKAGPRQRLHLAAALIREGDAIYLARRPDEGLFASLWELPSLEVGAEEQPPSLLKAWLGGEVAQEPLVEVEQTLTHRELRLSVYEVREVTPAEAALPAHPAAPAYVEGRFSDAAREPPGGLSSVTNKALQGAGKRAPR